MKKLLLTLLCVTLFASLALAVVPAAAEESKTTWSQCGGTYNGVTYNSPTPGGDYCLGTDTEGNLFFQTVETTPYAALPQTEYYVDGFKIDFKIAPTGNGSFNEGQTYYVGLGTTDMGILNALKLVYSSGAFELYAIAAGHNPDNGGVALANAEGPIRINAGETVSYQLKADKEQQNLDVYVNGYKTFTSPNYPCFSGSPAHIYYNRNGAYKGKIIVYDGLYESVAATPNRITVLGIQNGEYTREETVTSAASNVVDGKYWSYEDVLYAPNSEFFVGRDTKNNFFYQTHPSAYLNYYAISDAYYYANGFKTTFSFDLLEGQTFSEGYCYFLGLSCEKFNMPMVSVMFTFNEGKGFKTAYATAGLGQEADLTSNGEIIYVQPGEKTTLEFKEEAAGGLGIYINGVLGHTTARYPAHENATFTLPQNGLKQYAGYLSLGVNCWSGNEAVVGNRVTFYEMPDRITGKEVAPDAKELDGTMDPSLVYFQNFKIWTGLEAGNLTTEKFGNINYPNPINNFWLGETAESVLVYESEGAGIYNAYSDLKFKVDGFKMSFMVQNKGELAVGSKMFIGLSHRKNDMTMAAIEFKWTGKYFEMKYSSAGLLNYDGNELSTYGNIGHLWLGQRITFEYKANEGGGLDILVNGEKAFTTSYYPSFQGSPDFTFSQENGEYVGYFTVHNGTVDSTAVVSSRISFFELGSGEGTEEPIEDPKETPPEGLITEIDNSVVLETISGASGNYETEKYGEIIFANNAAQSVCLGVNAQSNLVVQSAGASGYGLLTASKAYVDGFKMSFMVQTVGENPLPVGYAIQLGLSNKSQFLTMAAIELKWTGKYFEMRYSSAGIYNYSGNELSQYSDEIPHLWLGQTMTFEYKANASGGLDIFVNGIYTFTTPYYPSFQGNPDYTFPADEEGKVYGYFTIHDGMYPNAANADHRITFSELTVEYTNTDGNYEYEVVEELAAADQETMYKGAATAFEGVTYTSNLGEYYVIGRDVNENLYYQSYNYKPFIALTDKKVYADGMKYSFIIQKIGENELADGSYFFVGIGQAPGAPNNSVYLVWNAKKQVFEMYYRAAGLTNGDGARFSTYHDDLHNLHLGEKVTVQFKQAESGALEVYMNDVYLFTTSTYPSFPGAPQFALPSDEYGYYGYLSILYNAGLPQIANNCDVRITFYDLVANGFASGTQSNYVASDAATYVPGTTVGSIAEDFVYATLTSGVGKGSVMYASGEALKFSFRYTDTAILNAVSFALNAVHKSNKDMPAYTVKLIDSADAENFVKVTIAKAAANKATVFVDGSNLGTITFDWNNANATSIYNIGLFVSEEYALLQIGSNVYVLDETTFSKLTSFAKDENGKLIGYIEIANEEGNSQMVISNLIVDGTAVQKKVAKAILTTIADVNIPFGAEFTNEYQTVEVSFFDGTTETWNVLWDDGAVNSNFAAPYTVTGTFENVISDYYFSEDIKAMLNFTVNVDYPEGYYKYGTSEYDNNSGSIWFTCGGGNNEFIYKDNGDGTYTIASDGYKSGKFMPASAKYRDIDGYMFAYTQKLLSGEGGMFIFSMLPEPKHPIEFGTPVIGLAVYVKADGTIYVNFYTDNQFEAYFKDAEGNVMRQLSDAFQGVAIRTEIIEGEERYVKFFIAVAGTEYELVNADGSEFTGTAKNLANFVDDRAYICLWNELGYSSYTFSEKYTRYAVEYATPADAIVDFGSEHGLPTEIELTLNDGSKVMGTVTWSGEYNKELAGTYKLEGIISYNGELGNGTTIFDGVNGKLQVSVTVREEVKVIKDFSKIEDITISLGEEYKDKLPTTFKVNVYSAYYGTTVEEEIQVVWTGNLNVLVAGTYTLTASSVGAYQFAEELQDNLTVNIIVNGDGTTVDCESCSGGMGSTGLISLAVLGVAFVAGKKRKN